jgi:8-hydroxy-5-deazaflavin:NADPH oxidoreductase
MNMNNKKTIGIIGATGNMGSALSKSLARAGFPLLVYGRDREEVRSLMEELQGSKSSSKIQDKPSIQDVTKEADVIILAVPYQAERELANQMRDLVTQKIVVSISNPLNDTYDALVTDPDTSAAEELQKALPDATVVKSFNTVFAADYAQPDIDGKKVDAFIAGDDERAVEEMEEIVKAMGLNPLVAGSLSTSRTLENMQLLLIQLNMKNNYNWRAGWKILH